MSELASYTYFIAARIWEKYKLKLLNYCKISLMYDAFFVTISMALELFWFVHKNNKHPRNSHYQNTCYKMDFLFARSQGPRSYLTYIVYSSEYSSFYIQV